MRDVMEISYMYKLLHPARFKFDPQLLRTAFSEMFCLWYNFVRSSHNSLHPCTLSADFSTPITRTRMNDFMSMWLKSRRVSLH